MADAAPIGATESSPPTPADGMLWLLQLVDGGFPSGGFADSRGFERISRGALAAPGELEPLIAAASRLSVWTADVFFALSSRRATKGDNAEALRAAAAEDLASRPARLQREATLRRGRATLRAARHALDGEPGETLRWAGDVLGERAPHATALGAAAAAAGVPADALALGVVYSEARGMANALVKLAVFSPSAAQGVIRRTASHGRGEAQPEMRSSFAPVLDIASMQHEQAAERLFES